MKKYLIASLIALTAAGNASAFQKAIYVKEGDTYTKYNFGVAGDLLFTDGGKTLRITGYSEAIDLDKIDYITFTAPVDDAAMTPSEQKQKMIDIATEVNAMIDINDYADLLRMYDIFFINRWDEVNPRTAYVNYYLPSEYWDVHRKAGEIIDAASQIAKGNVAAVRTLKAEAIDLYKASDYFGVYTANDLKKAWEKTADADYLEIRFNAEDGDPYSVKLQCSKEFTTWETSDFKGELPATMTIGVKKGNTELAQISISSKLVQDKSIDMTVDFTAANLHVVNTLAVNNDRIDDNVAVTLNGKHLTKADSRIYGKNLCDYNVMKPAVKEAIHYHDAEGNCLGDDPTQLFAHIFRASTEVDLIGKLQAKGKAFGFQTLYDELNEDEDDGYDSYNYKDKDGWTTYSRGFVEKADNEMVIICNDDLKSIERKVNVLNNYCDASFYYDGAKQLQGFLSFDVREDNEDYTNYWGDDPTVYGGGFTVVGGKLIEVTRNLDIVSDPSMDAEEIVKLQSWHYFMYPPAEMNCEPKIVTVAEKDVIHPLVTRNKYLEITPLLVFPDLSSHMFETYFDENTFSGLIDDYYDIINTYNKITGQDITE